MSASAISCPWGPGRVVRARRSASASALLPPAGLASSRQREHSGCRTAMLDTDGRCPNLACIRGVAGGWVGVEHAACDCALWPKLGRRRE